MAVRLREPLHSDLAFWFWCPGSSRVLDTGHGSLHFVWNISSRVLCVGRKLAWDQPLNPGLSSGIGHYVYSPQAHVFPGGHGPFARGWTPLVSEGSSTVLRTFWAVRATEASLQVMVETGSRGLPFSICSFSNRLCRFCITRCYHYVFAES